ncbi:MAG: hypothetical protein BMS9Abin13_024 [Patescibacteria group bacterium]|nr:MAG: hypothetical protein BMS9Abin13_024 [Patescibacteria group bacterium]
MNEQTSCFSREEIETRLSAAKHNMLFLADWLKKDCQHLLDADARTAFIKWPAQYVQAFAGASFFFVKRYMELCEHDKHLLASLRLTYLLTESQKQIFASNAGSCFIRRDVLWVSMTALVRLFLEEATRGNILFDDEYALDRETLLGLVEHLPKGWIDKVNSSGEERVMQIELVVPGSAGNIPRC